MNGFKLAVTLLVSLVLSALFMYSVVAYVMWEFNPGLWSEAARVTSVFLTLAFTGMLSSITLDSE